MPRSIALIILLAAAACSSEPAPQPSASTSPAAAQAVAPAAKSSHVPGCGDGVAVSIDGQGFDTGVETPFPPARLEHLRAAAEDHFRRAATATCAALPKARGALAKIKALAVVPGAGATEPVFYQDEQDSPRLNFQYAFIESDLALPRQVETELALRCWVDPGRTECPEDGD